MTFATAFLGSTLPSEALFAKFTDDADALQRRIDALSAGEPGDTVKKAWEEAGGDPAKLIAALLADGEHGVEGLARLMGSASDVEARVGHLMAVGDPAAASIFSAWANATGTDDARIADFVGKLERPALVTRAVAGVESVKAGLDELEDAFPPLGTSLKALWNKAGNDFDQFRHEIEDWFDREMARVSGWYSRWAQWLMLGIALVVAFGLNISAFTIGKALWNDPTLREKATLEARQQVAAASAESASGGTTADTAKSTTEAPAAADTLKDVGFPLGWNATSWPGTNWGYLILHIMGIILVAVAASFGAPFWFDALNKLVNLRMTGSLRPPRPRTRCQPSSNAIGPEHEPRYRRFCATTSTFVMTAEKFPDVSRARCSATQRSASARSTRPSATARSTDAGNPTISANLANDRQTDCSSTRSTTSHPTCREQVPQSGAHVGMLHAGDPRRRSREGVALHPERRPVGFEHRDEPTGLDAAQCLGQDVRRIVDVHQDALDPAARERMRPERQRRAAGASTRARPRPSRARAASTITALGSMPTTSSPASAKSSRSWPAPQPTSRIGPRGRRSAWAAST